MVNATRFIYQDEAPTQHAPLACSRYQRTSCCFASCQLCRVLVLVQITDDTMDSLESSSDDLKREGKAECQHSHARRLGRPRS